MTESMHVLLKIGGIFQCQFLGFLGVYLFRGPEGDLGNYHKHLNIGSTPHPLIVGNKGLVQDALLKKEKHSPGGDCHWVGVVSTLKERYVKLLGKKY